MGLRVRKSIKLGKHVKLNVSKSGVSTSVKVGNVTHNSKRGTTVNLGNGISYHLPNNKDTKVNIKTSAPVRSQQKTMPIETKYILINYINFIVKIILYIIAAFGTLGFICVLFDGGNIATLLGTIVIALGSGIAAKKINIKK